MFPNPSTQFKPGKSGNPAGRPKGRSLAALLREALDRPTAAGRTVADAMVDALLRIALEGDRQAIRDVFDRVEGRVPVAAPEPTLTVRDVWADAMADAGQADEGEDEGDGLAEAAAAYEAHRLRLPPRPDPPRPRPAPPPPAAPAPYTRPWEGREEREERGKREQR